jgi:hypothetical protein
MHHRKGQNIALVRERNKWMDMNLLAFLNAIDVDNSNTRTCIRVIAG